MELQFDLEETFSIKIPNDVSEGIETVGQAFDYIVEQTGATKDGGCRAVDLVLDQVVSGLIELVGHKAIKGSTKLAEVLPTEGRRKFWRDFGKATELRLPGLVRPGFVTAVNVVLAGSMAIFVFVGSPVNEFAALVFALAMFVAAGLLLYWTTSPFARETRWDTVEELAKATMVLNLDVVRENVEHWTEEDVWIVLKLIIVHQLGVDECEVDRDARLVQDLGCD